MQAKSGEFCEPKGSFAFFLLLCPGASSPDQDSSKKPLKQPTVSLKMCLCSSSKSPGVISQSDGSQKHSNHSIDDRPKLWDRPVDGP
jgi:hypothetical protein